MVSILCFAGTLFLVLTIWQIVCSSDGSVVSFQKTAVAVLASVVVLYINQVLHKLHF